VLHLWKVVGEKEETEEAGDDDEASKGEMRAGTPHPRVFCKKSVDLLDSKGLDFFHNDKEFATV